MSTKLLLPQVKHFRLWDLNPCFPFSGLHRASFFGIVETVAALIEAGCYGIDEEYFSSCTPLSWAARNGYEEAVKILLSVPNRPVRPALGTAGLT